MRNSSARIWLSIYALEPRTEAGESEPFLAGFHRLELPVTDAGGNSRWPERFTPERLAQIRRRTGPARYASQMLLTPTSAEDGRLDPERLLPYGDELSVEELSGGLLRLTIGGRRMVSASCWWDPAYGSPRKGDGSVIAAVFSDAEGHSWLHRILWMMQDERDDADPAMQLCRRAAKFAADLYLPAIRVETNGLGRFLPGLLRKAIAESGGAAGVIEETNHKPKAVRILEAFDARLAAGVLHMHDSVRETRFLREMREWRPGPGRGHQSDDGLDAVAGCLLSEPVRIGSKWGSSFAGQRSTRRDWRGFAAPHLAESQFDV